MCLYIPLENKNKITTPYSNKQPILLASSLLSMSVWVRCPLGSKDVTCKLKAGIRSEHFCRQAELGSKRFSKMTSRKITEVALRQVACATQRGAVLHPSGLDVTSSSMSLFRMLTQLLRILVFCKL